MQTFIDFLVNNYTWFIIISLILVFALIGYLVDTSERPAKNNLETGKELDNSTNSHIRPEEMEVLNMNTDLGEIAELEKDVIVMPKAVETPSTSKEQITNSEIAVQDKTEVLDI